MKKYICALLLAGITKLLCAQQLKVVTELVIGDRMPDINVTVLSSGSIHDVPISSLYKDQAIILDFWATWCTSCIGAMADADSVAGLFGGKLKIIPTTYQDPSEVLPFISKNRLLKNLRLDYIVSDIQMPNRFFKFKTVPHEVWIDKSGIISAITYPDEIVSENVLSFFNGNTVAIPEKKDVIDFDPFKKLDMLNDDFSYRSILGPYKPGYQAYIGDASAHFTGTFLRSRFFAVNQDLVNLFYAVYSKGYQGNIYLNRIEIESTDSVSLMPSRFEKIVKGKAANRYRFTYEMIWPQKIQGDLLYSYIMNELNNLLPFTASIEKRYRDCWVLQVDNQKIVSSLKPRQDSMTALRFLDSTIRGYNINMELLTTYLSWNMDSLPVINETGLEGRFDIHIPMATELTAGNYVQTVNQALKEYGVRLTAEKRNVDILVIRDKSLAIKNQ